MHNKQCRLLLLTAFFPAMVVGAGGQKLAVRGFEPVHSQRERELERRLIAVPNSSRSEAEHKVLTAEPHMAGSLADRRTAEYMLQQFRSYGLEAAIEQFDVLLSEPREVKLDLLAPVKFAGPTPEFVRGDPASKDSRIATGFNAYSASGDVSGEVIFANRGLPSDYEHLRAMSISVAGKIVMVRRGNSEAFRGVKAKVAEQNRAAGLIIYSDPDDNGYHAGDTYPKGPWQPPLGVQRGTLLYEFLYPGDPTTPDGPSIPGTPRIETARSNLLPRIPVLPLSYADAKHILENLGGQVAPRPWQGGLPITYHLGPGPSKVRLRIHMDNRIKPIWVVVARISGAVSPNEIIVLGNHRDAWTYGGIDPGSGTVAMLEMARSLGELMHGGWRPRRSIWICSWDAEEQGMIGSTEWAEKHAAELGDHAVAYLNLDVAVAGADYKFYAAAVPSLKEFMREVAAEVSDPRGGSILARAQDEQRKQLRLTVASGSPLADSLSEVAIDEQKIDIENLGSGTDYVAFLDHLGVSSTDFGFGDEYGAYHSIFDNHRYVKEFGDPGFKYQVAAAQYYGVLSLRLADADLLPFDYEMYAREIEGYLDHMRHELLLLGRADQLDCGPAEAAARRMAEIGRDIREKYEGAISKGTEPPDLERVNRTLAKAERAFLLPQGLSGRPWYKHAVFAPGIYSADAAMPLPGVQEGINENNFEEAARQMKALTAAIDRVAQQLSFLR